MANPIKFYLVQNSEQGALTAYFNDEMYTADNTHASWAQLIAAITAADENTNLNDLAALFDPSVGVQKFFERVSERVSVAGGHVFFDGEEVNDGLSDHIIRFISEGNDASPLVNFLENIMTNPNEHSRTQLYDWLSKRDFTITPKGNFLAYKGVRSRRVGYSGFPAGTEPAEAQYPYESISSGRAIVDGQVYSGAIPNGIGAVVEMPRGEVAHDPNVACHTGLHAGNWRYASSFAQGAVLTVEINPRDVVSVPHDSNSEKIRCCRYVVKDITEQEYTTSFYGGYDSDGLDEDWSDDAPYEEPIEDEDEDEDVW